MNRKIELRYLLKLLLGSAGILFGIIGIILSIFVYSSFSQLINTAEEMVIQKVEHGSIILNDIERIFESASKSTDTISDISQNFSSTFISFGEELADISDSIYSLSDTLSELQKPLIPQSAIEELRKVSRKTNETAEEMKEFGKVVSPLHSKIKNITADIQTTKADISKAKTELKMSENNIKDIFIHLKRVSFLLVLLFILLFLILIFCSIGIIL